MAGKCVLLMVLVFSMGPKTVWAAVNPIGTAWTPALWPVCNVNPVLDSTTGNPLQAWYTIRYTPYFSPVPADHYTATVAATHDYSQYAGGLMDNYTPGSWRLTGKFNSTTGAPCMTVSGGKVFIKSETNDWGASVWAFIAPQTGTYQVQGSMYVNNNKDTNTDNTSSHNPYITVEAFTLSGSGHTTYTAIATYHQADGVFTLPTSVRNLQAGDMICIANTGGATDFYTGGGYVYINDNATGTTTPGMVTITLMAPPTATPTFNPAGGNYGVPRTVTISCADNGTIRYTTDGSNPNDNSTLYTLPLTISDNTTLKAKAWAAGKDPSDVATAVYLFPKNPIGTTWTPALWPVCNVNPVLDNATGNPLQAWYTIRYTPFSSPVPADRYSATVAATRDYSQYAGGLMDNNVSGSWRLTGKFNAATGAPCMGVPTGKVYIKSETNDWGASVWAFIAPQAGTYQVQGSMYVNNNNDAAGATDNSSSHSSAITVEAFTLSGSGHTTYTAIATYRQADGVFTLPTSVMNLQTGDMICIANTGGTSDWYGGGGYVYINDNTSGTTTPGMVTIMLMSPKTALPSFNPGTGTYTAVQTVTIGCTDNATIRYTTTGLDPDNTSPMYSAPLTINCHTTVKAKAWAAGKDPSDVATAVYTFPVATPTFTPDGGNYAITKTVTIGCATPGATIYYTTDNSTPTVGNGTVYHDPITISGNVTLKAMAVANEFDPGAVSIATYTFPTAYNRPVSIPYGTATIDGDLSDWNAATWIPLDLEYWPTGASWPTDIPAPPFAYPASGAYYAARWTPAKVYMAVMVYDTAHAFNDGYAGSIDSLEMYLHTTGFSGPGAGYQATFADAQQYVVGPMFSDPNVAWTSLGGSKQMPAQAEFSAACKVAGNWIYYEAALKPFKSFDKTGSGSVLSPLSTGDVIGLDAAVNSYDSSASRMIAENLLKWKSQDYTQFGLHVLAGSSAYTSADLAAILVAMDAKPGVLNWNPTMDLDGDGEITSSDLAILLANMQ